MKRRIIYISIIAGVSLIGVLPSIISGSDFYTFQHLYETEQYDIILDTNYMKYTDPVGLHNMGNTYYQLSQVDEDKKEEFLQQSLTYFSGSLSQEEFVDTRFNYEFVKKLLETEQKSGAQRQQESQKYEQYEQNEQGSQDETSTSEEEEKQESEGVQEQESSENQESETSQTQGTGTSERGESYMLQEDEQIQDLTQEEEQALDQTLERLEAEQMYYQRFFNKKPQTSDRFEDLFQSFFGNIERGGEKDW